MPSRDRQNPFAPDERDPFRLVLYGIGGVAVIATGIFLGRYLLFQYQMSVVKAAVSDIQSSTTKSIEQIQRNAAAAQQAAAAGAEAERQAKARAERERLEMQQAAIDRANAAAAAKEAA